MAFTLSVSMPPWAVVKEEEPTLTTILLALEICVLKS
jgi:hypothetical protein